MEEVFTSKYGTAKHAGVKNIKICGIFKDGFGIFKDVRADHIDQKERVGVCIDTQHAWASGYDWRNNFDNIWDDFSDIVGMEYLVALHLNDSKSDLGSRVDRHDNIGMGKIGKKGFKKLMQVKRLNHLAGYLETPGGPEMWKPEIAALRKLAEE